MTLVLRKCQKDGLSSFNFYYGNTGDTVTAPDWDPKPKCGNGLHGLKEGNGSWDLLDGEDWLVIEVNDDDIVDIDENKCKFRTGKIVFRGTTKQLSESEFPSKLKLCPNGAYCWAYLIGNHDIMIHKITDSYHAYCWALYYGNRDVMIDRITDSKWAFWWALEIGNRDIMMHKITDSFWAYNWRYHFGNNDIIMNKITDSYDAYCWAISFGNHDVMKSKITEKLWIQKWNDKFPDNKIES